jgi:hypothetical protein
MDLTPAADYGELHFILTETENPFKDLTGTARRVHNYLVQRGFCRDDFLVLVGNPALIAVVSAVAASQVGSLRVLQWSRSDRQYRPVEVQLPGLAGLTGRG